MVGDDELVQASLFVGREHLDQLICGSGQQLPVDLRSVLAGLDEVDQRLGRPAHRRRIPVDPLTRLVEHG
jgi:hypothetical protein